MAECEWVLLCDYAFADHRGKLCLIGIFDVITASNAPAKHQRSAIGFSILGEPGERVECTLKIIGPSGQVVATAKLPEATLPDSGGAQGQLEVRDLVLPEFGRYAVEIDTGDGSPRSAWITLQPKA